MFLNPGLKQRLLPLCAFFGTFTTVMTILIFSTDLKGRRYGRMRFNLTHSDLENAMQDNHQLIDHIRGNYMRTPTKLAHEIDAGEFHSKRKNYNVLLQSKVAEISGKKSNGVFIETGAYRHGSESETEWLELDRGWSGLLTQPDPNDYKVLQQRSRHRSRAHIANVCLSPTANPKQLEAAGVRGVALRWFRSFLRNREQQVRVGAEGCLSSPLPVTVGVLQGSVSSAILFIIFINDLLNIKFNGIINSSLCR
ncbi:protein Star isoform X2 [Nilaparvata lugens]|uniref:protein Star isoform X2 n=1 Tax=Nilaparvata lugens TaxID=108931 RepID=UPI00193E467C|nr:protein Star isoform X2 [Nilaparvata lugens]XP_039296119.1 protein Star isoform X2 [Nilaparvata lugens]